MALIQSEELQSIQISEGIVHLGECNSCITLRLRGGSRIFRRRGCITKEWHN